MIAINELLRVSENGSHSGSLDIMLRGWDRAMKAIQSLRELEPDWDGQGGHPIPADKLASAVSFCRLMRADGKPPPSAVYPLSDGNVMIEWSYPDGVMVRFEIESPGRGEFMATFPDDRKAEFSGYHWEFSSVEPAVAQDSVSP